MDSRGIRTCLRLGIVAASILLAACDIRARGDHHGRDADLDVRTPFGGFSARTDIDTRETGLPSYPGARPLRDRDEGDRASVRINSSFFDFEVAAAKFESADKPEAVEAFYREAMRTYGEVLECRGDVDFEGRRSRRRAVCDESFSGRETQLVAGSENNHRTVSIKPRGSGSEFAIVYINTRGDN